MNTLNNILVSAIMLTFFVVFNACILNDNPGSNILKIATGTSFGQCIGYCRTSLEIDGEAVEYIEESWKPDEYPAKNFRFNLSSDEKNALQMVFDTTDISGLEETIGCPDCADGGAEWLQITHGSETRKVTFEFAADIGEISALMALLRPLRQRAAALMETVGKGAKIELSEQQAGELVLHEYKLSNAAIEGNYLLLTVRYPGGCEQHDFNLFMAPNVFMESNPVQASLILRHDNHGDNCEAMLSRQIGFDLTPLIDLYKSQYNGRTDPVILNISSYTSGKIELAYKLAFSPEE